MSFLTCANGFTLCSDYNDILVDLDAILVSEDTGEHDFGSIADGVNLEQNMEHKNQECAEILQICLKSNH